MTSPRISPEIQRYLAARRVASATLVAGVLGSIATAIIGWIPSEEVLVNTNVYWVAAAVFGLIALIAGEFLKQSNCAGCADRFAARLDEVNWNVFALRCANCGLGMDGSNVPELPAGISYRTVTAVLQVVRADEITTLEYIDFKHGFLHEPAHDDVTAVATDDCGIEVGFNAFWPEAT